MAYDFGYYLSEKGFYISSGLAHGIDEAASWWTGASTNHCSDGHRTGYHYPAQHKQLAEEIRQSGAIVTEFLPATLPLAAFFPRRNRIVSGRPWRVGGGGGIKKRFHHRQMQRQSGQNGLRHSWTYLQRASSRLPSTDSGRVQPWLTILNRSLKIWLYQPMASPATTC